LVVGSSVHFDFGRKAIVSVFSNDLANSAAARNKEPRRGCCVTGIC
jgi:hypothetical protein